MFDYISVYGLSVWSPPEANEAPEATVHLQTSDLQKQV